MSLPPPPPTGFAADVRAARQRLKDLEKVMSGLRLIGPDGEASADPKVVRFLAFHKDIAEIKHQLDDLGKRLDRPANPASSVCS